MNDKAGREMDAQVHKVLWPNDEVQCFTTLARADNAKLDTARYSRNCGQWKLVPYYSTELSAWNFAYKGWRWQIAVSWKRLTVTLCEYDGRPGYMTLAYAQVDLDVANWQGTVAEAMSRCVLEWAGVR